MASSGILVTQFDYSKLFIWNNYFRTATYTNATGSTVTLAKGTIMGRVDATNKVYPQVSTATDGSQVPRFILANAYTVLNGASVTVTYCTFGKVALEGVVLGGSDTLATPILASDSSAAATTTRLGLILDLLAENNIILESTTENTYADNA